MKKRKKKIILYEYYTAYIVFKIYFQMDLTSLLYRY